MSRPIGSSDGLPDLESIPSDELLSLMPPVIRDEYRFVRSYANTARSGGQVAAACLAQVAHRLRSELSRGRESMSVPASQLIALLVEESQHFGLDEDRLCWLLQQLLRAFHLLPAAERQSLLEALEGLQGPVR